MKIIQGPCPSPGVDILRCPIIHHKCTPNNLVHVHASPTSTTADDEDGKEKEEENNSKSVPLAGYM